MSLEDKKVKKRGLIDGGVHFVRKRVKQSAVTLAKSLFKLEKRKKDKGGGTAETDFNINVSQLERVLELPWWEEIPIGDGTYRFEKREPTAPFSESMSSFFKKEKEKFGVDEEFINEIKKEEKEIEKKITKEFAGGEEMDWQKDVLEVSLSSDGKKLEEIVSTFLNTFFPSEEEKWEEEDEKACVISTLPVKTLDDEGKKTVLEIFTSQSKIPQDFKDDEVVKNVLQSKDLEANTQEVEQRFKDSLKQVTYDDSPYSFWENVEKNGGQVIIQWASKQEKLIRDYEYVPSYFELKEEGEKVEAKEKKDTAAEDENEQKKLGFWITWEDFQDKSYPKVVKEKEIIQRLDGIIKEYIKSREKDEGKGRWTFNGSTAGDGKPLNYFRLVFDKKLEIFKKKAKKINMSSTIATYTTALEKLEQKWDKVKGKADEVEAFKPEVAESFRDINELYRTLYSDWSTKKADHSRALQEWTEADNDPAKKTLVGDLENAEKRTKGLKEEAEKELKKAENLAIRANSLFSKTFSVVSSTSGGPAPSITIPPSVVTDGDGNKGFWAKWGWWFLIGGLLLLVLIGGLFFYIRAKKNKQKLEEAEEAAEIQGEEF